MTVSAHIEALETKHKELENAVATEIARPSPDFSKVTIWKKQKLRIKEEIAQLRQHSEAA